MDQIGKLTSHEGSNSTGRRLYELGTQNTQELTVTLKLKS